MAMKQQSLTAWLNNESVKAKMAEKLGKNAPAVASAMLTIYNENKALQECDPRSMMGAGMLAATSGLAVMPTLGQAFFVPYKGKVQFQVGYRGLIQLAHRTGKYAALHAGKVYEGELRGFNPLTGEPIPGERVPDAVVAGYVAYMRLVNGFEKTLYMSLDEIDAHAEKYSVSYSYDKRNGKQSSPWTTNFDAMACKTVLKRLLNHWGILSTEMATVIQGDQSVVDKNSFTYVDNKGDVQSRDGLYIPEGTDTGTVDMETGEVLEAEVSNDGQ